MKNPRLPIGSSDPVSFTCSCPASTSPSGGLVLLFYRYFAATPPLPPSLHPETDNPTLLSTFHTSLTKKYNLGGKIRIAKEGFNITVGGTKDEIAAYMGECMSHWSFSGLELDTEDKQWSFFKPTTGGCACVFGGTPASVRVTAEITPMGVTNYVPANWDIVESLSPAEFHERCWDEGDKMLLDVRNYYESRIGYFVDPRSGEKAVTPGIRRFSQWPQYVKSNMKELERGGGGNESGRDILTYCTGGIRCEKGVRFMAENMEKREGDRVCTLKGGIAAYLMWMDEEIKQGKRAKDESLFRGKNYVFDGRGSIGLSEAVEVDPVSECHMCKAPSDRLSKCRSGGCHLVLVVCPDCETSTDPRCCQECWELNDLATNSDMTNPPRPICACEKERESKLWGGQHIKLPKTQGWRKGRKQTSSGTNCINIQFKTID